MTAKQLIEILQGVDEYAVVICSDENGGWDNILRVDASDSEVKIVWGGGSPFSSEK